MHAADTEEALAADIAAFAIHERHGGWALAHLVVKRVEPGQGNGLTPEQSSKRFGRTGFLRISAKEFARRGNTSHKRVLAYHAAWERAAGDGLVPPAADLHAGEFVVLPVAEDAPFFGKDGYYRSYDAATIDPGRKEAIATEAAAAGIHPGGPVAVAKNLSSVKAAILADPATRTAAEEAIKEAKRREKADDRAHQQAKAETYIREAQAVRGNPVEEIDNREEDRELTETLLRAKLLLAEAHQTAARRTRPLSPEILDVITSTCGAITAATASILSLTTSSVQVSDEMLADFLSSEG